MDNFQGIMWCDEDTRWNLRPLFLTVGFNNLMMLRQSKGGYEMLVRHLWTREEDREWLWLKDGCSWGSQRSYFKTKCFLYYCFFFSFIPKHLEMTLMSWGAIIKVTRGGAFEIMKTVDGMRLISKTEMRCVAFG